MKNKSYLLFICLNLLIVCFLISCKGVDAKVVSKIPDGFVSLIELDNRADNILEYIFWENLISFYDASDRVGFYQTHIRNRDFIVKYKNEYYVNEATYLEFTNIALIAREERQRTYNFGDTIEILARNGNYYVTIKGVDEKSQDDKKICDIKYSITTDVSENNLKSIFESVEITVGTSKGRDNVFDFIDSETIRLEMKADRKLEAIILKSPEYMGLTYRVIVNE